MGKNLSCCEIFLPLCLGEYDCLLFCVGYTCLFIYFSEDCDRYIGN